MAPVSTEVGKSMKRKSIGKIDKKTIVVGKSDSKGTCFVCGKRVETSAKNKELDLEADVCYDDLHCHDNLMKHFKVIVRAGQS